MRKQQCGNAQNAEENLRKKSRVIIVVRNPRI